MPDETEPVRRIGEVVITYPKPNWLPWLAAVVVIVYLSRNKK